MGLYGYFVWAAVGGAKLFALVAVYWRREYRRLFALQAYLWLALICEVLELFFFRHYGVRSYQYLVAYFLLDLADAIAGYFILVRLLELAFERTPLPLNRLRPVALAVFSGVTAISGYVVFEQRHALLSISSCKELEQNFNFLGLTMALLLFFGLNFMAVPGIQYRRMVLAFAILYSSRAITWALSMLLAQSFLWRPVVPLANLACAAVMAYAVLRGETAITPQLQPSFALAGGGRR
jgi:hypothetical protein